MIDERRGIILVSYYNTKLLYEIICITTYTILYSTICDTIYNIICYTIYNTMHNDMILCLMIYDTLDEAM